MPTLLLLFPYLPFIIGDVILTGPQALMSVSTWKVTACFSFLSLVPCVLLWRKRPSARAVSTVFVIGMFLFAAWAIYSNATNSTNPMKGARDIASVCATAIAELIWAGFILRALWNCDADQPSTPSA